MFDLKEVHARQTVLEDIATERRRQIEAEGWLPAHDDLHDAGKLASAAACYAAVSSSLIMDYPTGEPPPAWPWADEWWKPTTPRRNLVKAAALIVAEIERIDRRTEAAGARK